MIGISSLLLLLSRRAQLHAFKNQLDRLAPVACRNAPPPAIGVILHEKVCQLLINTRPGIRISASYSINHHKSAIQYYSTSSRMRVKNHNWSAVELYHASHLWYPPFYTSDLSHGFQCSPTLNHQPYEGTLPLTSWWRKSSNMTDGQSSLISLAHHCYD